MLSHEWHVADAFELIVNRRASIAGGGSLIPRNPPVSGRQAKIRAKFGESPHSQIRPYPPSWMHADSLSLAFALPSRRSAHTRAGSGPVVGLSRPALPRRVGTVRIATRRRRIWSRRRSSTYSSGPACCATTTSSATCCARCAIPSPRATAMPPGGPSSKRCTRTMRPPPTATSTLGRSWRRSPGFRLRTRDAVIAVDLLDSLTARLLSRWSCARRRSPRACTEAGNT